MTCTCPDWEPNIAVLTEVDASPFAFCPWCGRGLTVAAPLPEKGMCYDCAGMGYELKGLRSFTCAPCGGTGLVSREAEGAK